jgi:predicted NUDIX family NTP pyrophosphohydrolase
MAKISAGILLYRKHGEMWQVLLVHPGGPFWAKKEAGAWSIPKGECSPGEEPLACARREYLEETGFAVDGDFIALGEIRQAGGKLVKAWAAEGDLDPGAIRSNIVKMELPRKSGRFFEFPEVDRAGWFTFEQAHERVIGGQRELLTRLEAVLATK